MGRRLVFSGKQKVEIEEFEPALLGPDQVRMKTEVSLISTGTEGIVYNRLFDPGTHWDKWVHYPMLPGYSAVGLVEAVGSAVERIAPGDRVVMRQPHSSHNIDSELSVAVVPEGIAPEEAAWFALAKIASMGARAADYRLGDRVLIIGAGPIGQMAVRWAVAAGCEKVIAVDRFKRRLEMATTGGASAVIARPVSELKEELSRALDGELPDIVMDTTGNAEVFTSALALVKRMGRVVILGDTGSPARQHLTPDVMMKGIRIVAAHDSHETEEWHSLRIYRLFFELVASRRFSLEGLNTHIFSPDQYQEAYDTISSRREDTMGILFDWR